MKIGDIVKTEIYPEICCEECFNVIHNHFECPVCGNDYAGTNIYMDVDDFDSDTIVCEECQSKFKRVSETWLSYDPIEIEIVSMKSVK